MIRLQKYSRRCECGESWGVYYSSADAVVGGRAITIGVDNDSLAEAIETRPEGFGGKVSKFQMWVEGLKRKIGRIYAFAYGHRATGAMNVDSVANDRANLMKAMSKRVKPIGKKPKRPAGKKGK